MKTLDGTDNTAVLLLETENVNPPEGATPCARVIRNSVTLPLPTVAAVAVSARTAACLPPFPVVLRRPATPGFPQMIGSPMHGLPPPYKSPVPGVPPPI